MGNSALVKTSWNGGDPNWGRIIDALGYSPAKVVEEKIDIAYSAPEARKLTYSLKKGRPTRTSFETLCAAVAPAASACGGECVRHEARVGAPCLAKDGGARKG